MLAMVARVKPESGTSPAICCGLERCAGLRRSRAFCVDSAPMPRPSSTPSLAPFFAKLCTVPAADAKATYYVFDAAAEREGVERFVQTYFRDWKTLEEAAGTKRKDLVLFAVRVGAP